VSLSRPSVSPPSARPSGWPWRATLVALTAVLAAIAFVLGHAIWVGAGVGLVAAGVLFVIDIDLLPAIALTACVLLPTSYLTVNTYHGALSPALGVVLALLLRAGFEGLLFRRGPQVLPFVLLGLWIVIRAIDSPIRTTSLTWSVSFLALALMPGLLLPGWSGAQRRVERCWLALGGVLGLYGLMELVLQSNPIFGRLYAAAGTILSEGSVYRITTTLGDPLLNGVFFSIAALLGLGRIFNQPARWEWVATLLSLVGVFGTSSRGAALAFGIGMLIVIAGVLRLRRGALDRRTVVTAALLVIAVAAGGGAYLDRRAGSAEAAGSTEIRLETYQAGAVLAREYFPLGAGPGLTDSLKYTMPIGQYQRGVESSAYEMLIDLGVPGVALIVWLFGAGALSALPRRPDLAACIVAYIVAASSFNLVDQYRPALLLWGLLIGLSVHPASHEGVTTMGSSQSRVTPPETLGPQ
jgi:hypothetical protein